MKSLIILILKLVYLISFILMQNTLSNRKRRGEEHSDPGGDQVAHCMNSAEMLAKHHTLTPETDRTPQCRSNHRYLVWALPISNRETTLWANSSLKFRNKAILDTREKAPFVNEGRKLTNSIISAIDLANFFLGLSCLLSPSCPLFPN